MLIFAGGFRWLPGNTFLVWDLKQRPSVSGPLWGFAQAGVTYVLMHTHGVAGNWDRQDCLGFCHFFLILSGQLPWLGSSPIPVPCLCLLGPHGGQARLNKSVEAENKRRYGGREGGGVRLLPFFFQQNLKSFVKHDSVSHVPLRVNNLLWLKGPQTQQPWPWNGLWGGGKIKGCPPPLTSIWTALQLSGHLEGNILRIFPKEQGPRRAVAWAKGVYSHGGGIFITGFNIKEVWTLCTNPDNQYHLRKARKGVQGPVLLTLQVHSLEAPGVLWKCTFSVGVPVCVSSMSLLMIRPLWTKKYFCTFLDILLNKQTSSHQIIK